MRHTSLQRLALILLLLTLFVLPPGAHSQPVPAPPPPEEGGPRLELRDHREMADVPSPYPPEPLLEPLRRAEGSGAPAPLRWKAGDFYPEAGLDAALAPGGVHALAAGHAYVVVQYGRRPLPVELDALKAWGYETLDYIPEDAFIVRVAADKVRALADRPFVRAVLPLRPEWKIDPTLAATMESAEQALPVRLLALEPLRDVPLRRLGDSLSYRGALTAVQIRAYLADERVQWIEPNYVNRPSLASSAELIAADNVWAWGLDGTDVEVGIIDSGIESTHDHFSSVLGNITFATDHVNGGAPDDGLGHGTHVAGTIGGWGTFNGQTFRGIAPEADLIIERVFDNSRSWHDSDWSLSQIMNDVSNRGADIINNSWGHDSNDQYDSDAREIDTWARSHPEVTVLFANGNFPDTTNGHSPALAKNVIAVGATEDGSPQTPNGNVPTATSVENADLLSSLNAISGPADNRTKPDINAPGEWVTAPVPGNTYETWHGTSMASPQVAAVIALLKEMYGEEMRSDLIKAALINTAVPLDTKANQLPVLSGWGRVQAFDLIYNLDGEEHDFSVSGTLSDNSTQCSNSFPVSADATLIKATMVYLDQPGAVNANPALVNNLNMWLSSPSTAFVSMSDRNNVERVVESDPEAGSWQICVSAPSGGIPSGTQAYAAVVSVISRNTTVAATVPSSVAVAQNSSFDLEILVTVGADDWFAYGTWVKVETLHPSISLNPGSREAWIAGDLLQETWQPADAPEFVASSCGTFNDAIKVSVGGTNFATITRYVDVTVAWCDGYEEDDSAGQATWISGGSSQEHMIVPSGDEDWVKFNLSQSSGIVLETSSSSFPTADTRMWLYDSALNQEDYNDDKTTGDYYSLIERTCEVDPLPSGLYYVKVDEYGNNDEIWGYDLSLDVTPCGDSYAVYLPAVLRNYDPALLFFDDFSDPGSGWPEVTDQTDYRLAYLNGEYQVDENADQVRIPTSPVLCEHCRVEVDVRFASITYNAYGLAFAKQGDTFYAFYAWPDHDVCELWKYSGGWTKLAEGGCALNESSNHLGVEWEAPAMRAFVNGGQVLSASDGAFSGSRRVSPLVSGSGDARFDNFEVWQLP